MQTKKRQKFYQQLNDTIERERGYYTIVIGDFNAKIEKNNSAVLTSVSLPLEPPMKMGKNY